MQSDTGGADDIFKAALPDHSTISQQKFSNTLNHSTNRATSDKPHWFGCGEARGFAPIHGYLKADLKNEASDASLDAPGAQEPECTLVHEDSEHRASPK
jgi:hypothetical protein